jgi:hypothetical protein
MSKDKRDIILGILLVLGIFTGIVLIHVLTGA